MAQHTPCYIYSSRDKYQSPPMYEKPFDHLDQCSTDSSSIQGQSSANAPPAVAASKVPSLRTFPPRVTYLPASQVHKFKHSACSCYSSSIASAQVQALCLLMLQQRHRKC